MNICIPPQNIRTNIEGALKTRITAVENQIKASVDNKVRTLTKELHDNMANTRKDAEQSAGGWKLPFLIMIVIVIGAGIGLYLFYQNLKKTHML